MEWIKFVETPYKQAFLSEDDILEYMTTKRLVAKGLKKGLGRTAAFKYAANVQSISISEVAHRFATRLDRLDSVPTSAFTR